ncbi:hypothetical protein JM18_009069 [Phytophthora kernoviae]|uniref:Exportin(tRNA) n=3 Tax=Phytophthora kernoviae TaxID=325452 RepID=A0A921SA88_9STRA|nr:hypothetical protein JM18_009069 [Phytophthora kernoviae]
MTDVAAFECAVLCAFQYAGASLADQQAQTLKLQAESFCASIKSQSDGWKAELQLFHQSEHEQVKFYALQALQEALTTGVGDDVSVTIRVELLGWLQSHVTYVETKAPYLKTKLAVVLTLLIKRDYPDRWPTAFTELLNLLPQGASIVEMYFRLLQAINEEIVEFDAQRTQQETAHNMRIKDAMREGSCMRESFDAISRVLILELLASLPIQEDEEFAEEIGEVINAVGLELVTCKDAFRHTNRPDLLQVSGTMLCQLMPLVWELFAHESKDVSEEVFEVVNAVGGAMLRTETQAAGTPQNEAEVFRPSEYIPQILHGIYLQTRFPEESDSDAAEFEEYRRSLYTIFLNIVRQRPHDTLAFLTNLAQSLPAQFGEIDPRNLESFLSLVYRFKEGLAALKSVAVPFNEPGSPLTVMVVQIHSSMITASTNNTAPLHPSVLLTYYDLAVRYSKVLQNQSALIPAVLEMMFGLHGLAHPASHVRSRVCYLCLRLVKVIGSSVNPHASSIMTALQPRLAIPKEREEVASVHNSTYLAYDDQLYLFELAGQIIASLILPLEETGMNAKQLRYRYTIAVLDPLLQGLNTTLSELANGALTDEEYVTEHCASHLNAIAHVLKAFKGTDCMENHQETFTQVLTAAACVLRALPRAPRVRSKVIFTLHRLTTVLDREHFLDNVKEVLQALMMGCEQPEVVEIVQLVDQLIIKHKQALGGFLNETTLPFVQHLCALMPERSALANQETKDAPQLERESIQKYLYTFLLHLVTHGLDAVLISAKNVAQLENMLRLVLEGCAEVQDNNINRACFSIGSMLVERWIGAGMAPSPASEASGAATVATSVASVALRAELHAELSAEGKARFTQIAVQDFTRAMFAVTKLRHFDLDDMQTTLAVKEIVNMQVVLVGSLGVEYLSFLRDVFLPSAGCPAELAGSYVEQSYVAQAILEFLNDEENLFHISSGYWLMVMMTLSSLVAVCALNYVFFSASRIGANMRSLTMSLVYDKALKLSSAARQEYTTGEVLTLMSVDTERVFLLMIQGPWLFMGPLAFIISVVLIGVLFNFYAALAGAIVLIVVMVISVQQGRRIAGFQKKLLKVIDERVKLTSEALQGIRVMKFYSWEDSLAQRVEKLRAREVGLLRKFHMYQVINTVMLFLTPSFVSGATLGVYVLIHHTISVVEAFTLIAMVNICRTALNQLPQAVAGISKAKISYARLDAFLTSDEVGNQLLPLIASADRETTPTNNSPLLAGANEEHVHDTSIGRGCISIRDASFQWPSNTAEVIVVTPATGVDQGEDSDNQSPQAMSTAKVDSQSMNEASLDSHGFQLDGVNLEVERGSLVMIVGKVGSGKSSLLNALLGEMPRTSGVLEIGGRVSYVSQDTWIRNASLRDNILFEQDYDAERYARVLDASQLAMDLCALPNGDVTEIGERGINLSGGQKARVAIARAAYRTETDLFILDDPLSAVDPHVAHAIFEKCIVGLSVSQTRLLVLNSHYDLLSRADQVVVMHEGAIVGHGKYEEVLAQFPHLALEGASLDEETEKASHESNIYGGDEIDALLPTTTKDNQLAHDAISGDKEESAHKPSKAGRTAAGQLVRKEDRVKGTVGAHVYKAYFDETGLNALAVVIAISLAYCVSQGARTVVDWWPGHWARNMPRRGVDPAYSGTTFGMWYLGLIVLCSILTLIRGIMMIESCMRSSQHIHDELFRRVLHAPVTRYFDVTPVGRILNRFSNDLDQMDTTLPQEYQLFFQNVSMALGSLVVSAFASYWIGVSYIPLMVIFVMTGQYFKKTSRELKRLEGVTRTPVYNLFSETLSGLPTIRAFHMEGEFLSRNRKVVDTNANVYLTYWSASRWLATRLDLMSVVIIFVVTLYLVATRGEVGSMTSGISLTYALMLTSVIQWVMRSVDRVDNATTSVERLLHFRQIEREDDGGQSIAELTREILKTHSNTTQSWPLHGAVRFEGLCLRYRPELPLVLRGVDLDIAAGEKVGICGRTGAGKSSLMVALFRICDFESGRVFIDDVDITSIKLRELRRSLAIIPQDPVLFSGPLRENLDPFNAYSDERIWAVLAQVHMADSLRQWGAGLDFEVAEGGDNLSVGQRQLICIGRALLKDSKVVVLDEATANVDTATDALIQTTIRETFQDKTVLTIAHRINTIMHCDKIAVMDAGQVAEFGSPSELLAQPQSVFGALASSGRSAAS